MRIGRLFKAFFPLYRLPGTTATGRQRAMAAVLCAGAKCGISHTTAATAAAHAIRSRELHLTCARPRASDGTPALLTPCCRGARTWCVVDGIRLLRQLGRSSTARRSAARNLSRICVRACAAHGLDDYQRVGARPRSCGGRGRPGRRECTAAARASPGSRAHRVTAGGHAWRDFLRRRPLPTPRRQHPVRPVPADVSLPAMRVRVRCDGFEHHGSRLAGSATGSVLRRSRRSAGASCTCT